MQHVRNACSLAALVFLASACSGGAGTAPFSGAPGDAGTARDAAVRRLAAAPSLTLSGTIQSVTSSTLLVKSGQCGFISVGYGPSTTIIANGQPLAAGTSASVTGTGTCSTSLQASSITLQGAVPLSVIGTVEAFDAAHVGVQAGSACGMLNVLYTKKTALSGPPLAAGEVVFATGSGSCATQLQAAQIIVTSAAPVTLSGTVVAVKPTSLQVQTGTACGTAGVYLGVSTTVSGAAAVGSSVRVTGTGSCATQVLASAIVVGASPAPSPSATPSPAPSPTATAKPSASPTATAKPSASPTATAKPSASPTATAKPSASPTATAKPSASPTATAKPSATPAPSPSASPKTPTLYVAPTGSDANPGTSARPFATIQHASDLAKPGDTVSVADGTYTASPGQHGSTYVVLQNASGTAAAPIVVQAANAGKAIIDGGNYATNYCYGFNTGANYVTVTGFTMQHCGEGGIINNAAGKGNVSSHNIIHDIGQTQTCETTGRDGIFSGDGVVGFTSSGDTIYNIGRLPSHCAQSWLPYTNDHCVYAYGSNVTIANDTISNCHSGWGVQIGGGSARTDGTGFTITGNTFGPMNNPGGIVGDIVTFTPGGGHVPAGYRISGNTAVNPNGGYFINNIYYPGASTFTVTGNTASGASGLIDWGGQTPKVDESGNTPAQ